MTNNAPSPPRMIADAMLGKLARWLRVLGYDVAYEKKIGDDRLIERARAENRLVLTRDTHLFRCRWSPPIPMILVEDDRLPQQLRQISARLGLSGEDRLLSRCLECNVPLIAVLKQSLRLRVPEYVYRTQNRFSQCPSCYRIYWPGTHWGKIRSRLQALLENETETPPRGGDAHA
jgi:uncharacterized protein with PIN domain